MMALCQCKEEESIVGFEGPVKFSAGPIQLLCMPGQKDFGLLL